MPLVGGLCKTDASICRYKAKRYSSNVYACGTNGMVVSPLDLDKINSVEGSYSLRRGKKIETRLRCLTHAVKQKFGGARAPNPADADQRGIQYVYEIIKGKY